MGRVLLLTGLSLAVLLVCVLVNLGQVWALTISPNPPIAGEPFTITNGSSGILGSPDIISFFTGSTCGVLGGTLIGGSGVASGGSFSMTLPVGQYSASGILAANPCLPFTVDPPAPTSYVPVTIGGKMLPNNRLQILLPWLSLIAVLGIVAAYTLTTRRKTTKQK